MIDFNDIPSSVHEDTNRDEIRATLIAHIESVLTVLYPAGKQRRGLFLVGDVLGSPGDSLEIVLAGEKAGLWTDRATGDGGDIFDLIAAWLGVNAHVDFPRVLQEARELIGQSALTPKRRTKKEAPVDDLGPATAKWDYLDASGQLIAVVYRYDPPGRKKEFRPWDAKRRKMAPPNPRPLYNQPGMVNAAQVVLVEGEKCAQALINAGIVATTAMHGANAPVEKTDWSPLADKAVLIWPDRDKPGWEYATQAAQAILTAGAKSCHILYPPEEASEGWDAADAVAECFDLAAFLAQAPRAQIYNIDIEQEPAVGSDESVWGTEDALALAFTRRYYRDWRYVSAWGRWMMWDGHRWRAEDTLAATDLIRSVCRHTAMHADNPKIAARLASSGTVAGVERLARSDRRHAATTAEWDADPWLLNTPGGVVDLTTGRQRAHDRTDRMTRVTTATPGGNCPIWRQFLIEVTGEDIELQAYLQRTVGYALTGSTQEHALFFLYGTGANGKSVFVNTLATILGDYATNAPMDTFMETRNDRHPTDMASLRGARFVSAIETEQGRRWAESKIKNLTGGDKISARFMRQDFFEFLPQFKLFVAGNHKPAIRNIDEAMKRRLHLIPFTLTIPAERRDKLLQQKLLAERDGILAWAIQGCLDWQRLGRLDPPQQVRDATEEYFEAEDALGRWLDERCVREVNAKSLSAELFSDWKQWAESAGEFVGSQRRFSDLLITRGYDKWKNPAGLRGFRGIDLKHPHTPAYTPYADN
ncbi:putative DNA primase/helicase [Paraburkholderia eburnea]|uniref:Putative DNA primase/helicase n=1 Tax=Paraburkholderia eburnea TaxID=1189126 RepID=A0A2S4LXG3_9BURK|nr:phage/plasmid primase, P4 family [Paraburkholderia eburnea]POR47078.1 putative DNA primase/helicase [Paraburkholderia eburnea]PRZ18308.1 putative DNA primase/helicase [Paraburkholderia eburnea]